MTESRKKFHRETPDQRRESLIQATLAVIATKGPSVATVRNIALQAGVTQGLIRHYFSSKEELVSAAYEHHMNAMIDATSSVLDGKQSNHRDRLAAFVTAALTPPVVDRNAVALWAGFIHLVQRDKMMHKIHKTTYYQFRDKLQALIDAALNEAGHPVDATVLQRHAIACNAVIDGLWLEGGALPEAFENDELPNIGLTSVASILGISLKR